MTWRLLAFLVVVVSACNRAEAERLEQTDELARQGYTEGLNHLTQAPVALAEAARGGAPLDARARTLALASADLAAAGDAFARARALGGDSAPLDAAAESALTAGRALVDSARADAAARAHSAEAFGQALAGLGEALEARDDAAEALTVSRLGAVRNGVYYHRAFTLAARRMLHEARRGQDGPATAALRALAVEVTAYCRGRHEAELTGYCMAAERFTAQATHLFQARPAAREPAETDVIDAYDTLAERSALLAELEDKGLLH